MRRNRLLLGVRYIVILCFLKAHVHCESTLCAYSKKDTVKFSVADKSSYEDADSEPFITGELLDGNTTERCPSTKFCYTLWQEEHGVKNTTLVVAQGCWSAAEFDCREDTCVSTKKPQRSINNTTTKFCCCKGSMCNVNISDGFFPEQERDKVLSPKYVANPSYDKMTVIIAVLCSLVALLLIVIGIAWHVCSSSSKPSPDSAHLMEPPLPPSPTFNLDCLKIAESIGRGRYGHVFRGTLYNQSVAVKIFAAQHRQNFLNERNIYCLPFMDHTCLPKLIGAEERKGSDDRPEYLLVLSYAPNGCLQEYLTNNTIDWALFCKMAHCITQGLAHLHMEVRKEDKTKMCVAHRDLTSRNIVVKADGSCMLCDFGFAICISGSKYYLNGEEQLAESTSLIEVGTLRYMAPEVLEGAVNLRDCESSLKQIDVYALGLILWELGTRCSDLFQGVDVPEYKAPFIAEIGNHPTMEQLQHLVVKRKARPLFPNIWKDSNPAIKALKETIEDCWDQDAEARLTALCVEERLIELPVVWERYKAGSTIQGVSPTVNPTSTDVQTTTNIIQSSGNGWFRGSTFEMPVMRSNADSLSPTHWGPDSRYSGDFSMSENTAETSITMSPTELTPRSNTTTTNNNNLKNLISNNNITPGLRVTVPLQPYQGKNPTMERNLIMEPIEDITVSGNSLVERGDKFSTRNNSANSFNFEADLFNLQTNEASESNALVPNDVLGQSTRAANPIPYVQNAVHVVSTMPKQPNVPGNGHTLQVISGHPSARDNKTAKKQKGIVGGFKNLFKFPKTAAMADPPPPVLNEPSTTIPKMLDPPTVHVPKLTNTVPKPLGLSNLARAQGLDTEVFLMDPNDEYSMTQTVVRPVANRQVYSQTVVADNAEEPQPTRSKKPFFQNGFVQSQTHPQLCADTNTKMKRPNTLPITKLAAGTSAAAVDAFAQNSAKMPLVSASQYNNAAPVEASANEPANPEAGAANEQKNPRFSLYDDRIMTLNTRTYQQIQNTPCKLGSPHISVSVPMSIDSLCESEVTNFNNTYQTSGSQSGVNDIH